jgi:hypothetical protein
MGAKAMKINISKRVDDFIPPILLSIIGDDMFLAGGALRSYLSCKKINDFDLFPATKKVGFEAVSFLLENKFKKVFECPRGDLVTLKKKNMHVQIIMDKLFKTPQEVINSFDFTICMYATDGEFLYTTKDALKHLKQRALMLNKITYPASTIKRFGKYQKHGFKLPEGTIKQFVQILTESPDDVIDFFRVYVD